MSEEATEEAGAVESVADTHDQPEGLEWRVAGQSARRRTPLVERLMARDPDEKGIAHTNALADRFGVTPRTIERDKVAIRAANQEKCTDQVGEVSEVLSTLEELKRGSIADIDAAPPGHQNRAAHRNVVLKAMEQHTTLMFKLGYWAEVPRRHAIGQDPDADPVEMVIRRFGVKGISEELGNGRFAGAADTGGSAGRDSGEGGGEAPPGEGEA